MTQWLIDGDESEAIAPDDRGLAYGDGLFETIAIRDSACRFLDAHLQRLAGGCERLGIPYPGDELLLRDISSFGNCVHGSLKIIVTRGRGPRGYRPPASARPTRIVGLDVSTPVPTPAPVRVRYCSMLLGRNSALAGLKTLNRLENVLARAEWSDPGVHEGLLLNDLNQVVCGTMSNLFFVLDNELHTPDLSECGVNGVLRSQVLRLAGANDIAVKESRVSKADLAAADDVFLTNSLIGVWPVDELDGQRFQRSEITLRLMQLLGEAGVSECVS